MLPIDRFPAALRAIHRVLIHARMMAYDNEPQSRIAALLDQAELLPEILANDRDEAEFFQLMLEGIAEFQGCQGILTEYLQACGLSPDYRVSSAINHQKILEDLGLRTANGVATQSKQVVPEFAE